MAIDIIALFEQWFSYTAMQNAVAMDDMTDKINSDDNPEYRTWHITDADAYKVRSDKGTQKEFEASE